MPDIHRLKFFFFFSLGTKLTRFVSSIMIPRSSKMAKNPGICAMVFYFPRNLSVVALFALRLSSCFLPIYLWQKFAEKLSMTASNFGAGASLTSASRCFVSARVICRGFVQLIARCVPDFWIFKIVEHISRNKS